MKKVSLCFFICLCFFSISTEAKDLKILSEDSPPFNYMKDGGFQGPAVEIVHEIMNELQTPLPILVLPWSRAYHEILSKKDIAVFCMVRTAEREKLFHWLGPFFKMNFVFLAKKNKNFKITSLEDAKKVSSIGTIYNDHRELFLKGQGFNNLQSVNNEFQNAHKLAQDRIDLWLVPYEVAYFIFEKEKLNPNNFEAVFKTEEVDMYMAFSKNTNPQILKRWEEAFQKISQNGKLKQVLKKHSLELKLKK